MEMTDKIKSCPFCGGEAKRGTNMFDGGKSVWCIHCGAALDGFSDHEQAVKARNRRTNGWRPMSDPPPESGRYFVVGDIDGGQIIVKALWLGKSWTTGYTILDNVTHWQPMPKLPEDDDE
jgi:hypothetical protein